MDLEKMDRRFTDFVETLDYLEVCRITVTPDGVFVCPSESDGRVSQIPKKTRKSLGKFLRQLADRLEKDPPEFVERRKKNR
jgi:hypothetical protein